MGKTKFKVKLDHLRWKKVFKGRCSLLMEPCACSCFCNHNNVERDSQLCSSRRRKTRAICEKSAVYFPVVNTTLVKIRQMREGWGCKLGKTTLSIVFEEITFFKGRHVHSLTHRTLTAEMGGNGGKSWMREADSGRCNGWEWRANLGGFNWISDNRLLH